MKRALLTLSLIFYLSCVQSACNFNGYNNPALCPCSSNSNCASAICKRNYCQQTGAAPQMAWWGILIICVIGLIALIVVVLRCREVQLRKKRRADEFKRISEQLDRPVRSSDEHSLIEESKEQKDVITHPFISN